MKGFVRILCLTHHALVHPAGVGVGGVPRHVGRGAVGLDGRVAAATAVAPAPAAARVRVGKVRAHVARVHNEVELAAHLAVWKVEGKNKTFEISGGKTLRMARRNEGSEGGEKLPLEVIVWAI